MLLSGVNYAANVVAKDLEEDLIYAGNWLPGADVLREPPLERGDFRFDEDAKAVMRAESFRVG